MSATEPTTTVTLDAADAIELAEALGWLRDWFAVDRDTLAVSMRRHSFGMFSLNELDADLRRFVWLLGGEP
jgi:hypothetical protein